ncbi:glycosyltransferase [Bifidobacterium xylocopae]|uniref:Glycosyl transferase n=1 Tax=Bifidobacterium xylocopae TaxID=2493119 RepID=A0A366KEL4_9BIFI|nr:glycosyltransferase family 2 protein [Bifidobacterium xylocopae]RBP99111.1 glycosyl transferase [Bifidobacterium xylocopae]
MLPQNSPQQLVSVIVPVYNAERYLPACLDSIVHQTYTDLQVILVDDGSRDGSGAICDEYAARDGRISVIHQSNGGIAKAQNAGLDAILGRFIAFVDNDDILDSRNIELLLHALETTGADMSKGRWRQFGVSQLDAVAKQAAVGAQAPGHITVFKDPLKAYQSVFCKSLRLLGDRLGRKSEARYFNEANWCRLYRAELWEGVRFPEGKFAQDVMVAGQLYSGMTMVADLDVNLYNWLQSPSSVTHAERSLGFYQDNARAGMANFRLALEHGLIPMRSYYTMADALASERALTKREPALTDDYKADRRNCRALFRALSFWQRADCQVHRLIRLAEKHCYDRRIKYMR